VVSRRKVFDRIVEDGKSISAIALSTRDVYPNVPNGAVSIANRLILWDFEIHELHSKRAIFSIR